jgi:hypothetical protein
LYGHDVHLEAAERTEFTEPGDFFLYIDAELAGSIRPFLSAEWEPEEVLAHLSDQIEEYWAQDLGGGLSGVRPPPA